ncbi:MAG: site-2 protease family protein, partial [Butyricicoccus sp.]|nr:site-2 protease family protein [Butyricicoccus sp.]
LRLDIFGLRLDYSGRLGRMASLCAALAGPVAGLLYAFPAMRAVGQGLKMSGAISLLLSGFNLLPALPLDGGRVLALLCGTRAVRACSRVTALLLMAAGLWALFAHGSLSLLFAGGWLLAYSAG